MCLTSESLCISSTEVGTSAKALSVLYACLLFCVLYVLYIHIHRYMYVYTYMHVYIHAQGILHTHTYGYT